MRQNSIDIRVLLAEVVAVRVSRSQRCHRLDAYQRARTRIPIWRRSISTQSGRTMIRIWCNSSLPKSNPIVSEHQLATSRYNCRSSWRLGASDIRRCGTPLERSTTAHIPTPPVSRSRAAHPTPLPAEQLTPVLPPSLSCPPAPPPQDPQPSSPKNAIDGSRSINPTSSLPHHQISSPERALSPHQTLDLQKSFSKPCMDNTRDPADGQATSLLKIPIQHRALESKKIDALEWEECCHDVIAGSPVVYQ